jgi:sugar phosphate isomerase/epimerase
MNDTPLALAVSNIAWPAEALGEALAMLPDLGVTGVEIAPFNIFGRWDDVQDQARRLRDDIEQHGLRCVALQGILYNVPDVHLFESDGSRAALRRHLENVAALAGILGAPACVFGAPRQRDPGDLPAGEAWGIARGFLRDIGPVFHAYGTALAFEANASRYACRFVTTTTEGAKLVADIATPGIALQIDTGTIFLESEDPCVLLKAAPFAVHAHISEPDLQPIGSAGLDHAPIAAALRASSYGGVLSLEMRASPDWRGALREAISLAHGIYA